MNLPPELTERIEDTVGTAWPKAVYPLQHAVAVRILETFAEPLHKEIEELRQQRDEYAGECRQMRDYIQDLGRLLGSTCGDDTPEKLIVSLKAQLAKEQSGSQQWMAKGVEAESECGELKAQLAEAKDQITSLQYELAAANHQP